MSDLIARLLDPKLEVLEEGPQISRALNMIILRILENSAHNHVFHVLINVLTESYNGSAGAASGKFSDLVMKCIWKLCKSLPNMMTALNVDDLLRDIQRFLLAHPPADWKMRGDETPLRTMKTILHTLVKLMGPDVLKHLSLVGKNPVETTTGSYLMLMLEKSGHSPASLMSFVPSDEKCHNPVDAHASASSVIRSDSIRSSYAAKHSSLDDGTLPRSSSILDFTSAEERARLSPVIPQRVSEQETVGGSALDSIFAQIANRDTAKQGIKALWEHKRANPSADWQQHMQQLSSVAQSVITRGLQDLDEEHTLKTSIKTPRALPTMLPVPVRASASEPVASSTALQYMERLKQLQSRTTQAAAVEPVVSVAEVAVPQPAPAPSLLDAPAVAASEVGTLAHVFVAISHSVVQPTAGTDKAALEQLKARLAKFKKAT